MRNAQVAANEKQKFALAALLLRAATLRHGRGTSLRVIVIGEAGAGKTSLINALLGESLLPTGVISHTLVTTVIGFAAKPRTSIEGFDRKRVAIDRKALSCPPRHLARRLYIGLPREQLKNSRLIDTPGLARGDVAMERQTLGL